MIDVALTENLQRLNNGDKLKGSTPNGGITCAIIEHLVSYKQWANTNAHRSQDCKLRMGGLVMPLLHSVGFTPDATEEVAEPETVDLQYLKNCNYLQKTPDGGKLVYQF
ncbi:unnamed protein product [Microthlaspi erraticum]|uniref:Arabidopsis retrotransposon Orf1 C-terminal domain-containing protein n=1 Tax=Microthlaspi erraticum TaxID=1685480 RepID=A0A6D2JGR5_9BRAS|nr:unnamed protein product [Microthlaspi erraticum]